MTSTGVESPATCLHSASTWLNSYFRSRPTHGRIVRDRLVNEGVPARTGWSQFRDAAQELFCGERECSERPTTGELQECSGVVKELFTNVSKQTQKNMRIRILDSKSDATLDRPMTRIRLAFNLSDAQTEESVLEWEADKPSTYEEIGTRTCTGTFGCPLAQYLGQGQKSIRGIHRSRSRQSLRFVP